jgi:peptidoglycan/LPS O-acetylase OafA/YrhL
MPWESEREQWLLLALFLLSFPFNAVAIVRRANVSARLRFGLTFRMISFFLAGASLFAAFMSPENWKSLLLWCVACFVVLSLVAGGYCRYALKKERKLTTDGS